MSRRSLRVVPITRLPAAPVSRNYAHGQWPKGATPVFPLDTLDRMRAQSALCGIAFRDGSSQAPVLTLEQARDVLAWYAPRY